MPFDFRTFFKAFKLAYAEGPDPRRFVGLTLLLLFFPGVALFNALCLALDKALFPFQEVKVSRPVFIVGNARSGTTFMHRLMCRDEARFTYFKAWELFFPSLIQKKLIRGLGRFDEAALGGALYRGLQRFEDRAFARFRKLHPLSLTGSEEDETAMVHVFSSPFICVLFPYLAADELGHLQFFDRRPEAERHELMGFYEQLVQRQLYLDGGERALCSKNPLFSSKLRSLMERFPDARFVYMARNPYESIPSVQSMLWNMWTSAWCDTPKDGDAVRLLGEVSLDVYRYALEVLDGLPPDRFVTVRYDDLVADPKGTIEGVYARLGMDISPEYQAILEEEAARARKYTSHHSYAVDEFGLSAARIREALPEVFERFGWDPIATDPSRPGAAAEDGAA